ncbi:GFA family protein [bacterium]|nr:GFA family protein [bacterium]
MIGSCLCKKIKFEFDECDKVAMNCHCSLCRKSHGSAFATQLFSKKNSLVILRGKQYFKEYESIGGLRCFCSECGSRLMNYAKDNGSYMSVALSAVDDEHDIKVMCECFIDSKAKWVKVSDDSAQFETFPPNIADYIS